MSFKETTLKTVFNNEKITVEDDSFKVSKSGKYSFEYLNINQKINNIKIDIINIKEESKPLNILIEATDEANEVYLKLPEVIITNYL